jgi:hypothetical protein
MATKSRIIRPALASTWWLLVGIAAMIAMTMAYDGISTKSPAVPPQEETLRMVAMLAAMFGAGASYGAAIGALTRRQFVWAVAGTIAWPILVYVWLVDHSVISR